MAATSVRVALRVRPLNSKETAQNCSECISFIPDAPQILIGNDRSFTYDYIFSQDTRQEDVFDGCARPLVEKLLEGFNATILAYGQTGSGKTHSMGTALEDTANIPEEHRGIVPRAIFQIFSVLREKAQKYPDFWSEVSVSFLELYNEDLVDLLNPSSRESNKKGKSEISIREDSSGNIYWAGVKEEVVNSPEELLGQLTKGSLCRTVAATDMNAVSSRSHAIFSVIIKQTKIEEEDEEENKENDPAADQKKKMTKKSLPRITSKFHFVDLAGSERLKRTNAVGDRAKEGIAINGGLLALGNVISALGDDSRKATHIPYRDSKLTRLLQDSLGGNSQTLMLACVSPSDSNFMETLNTLKYANRARNIKNKVSLNESFAGSSVEINQLRSQISKLKLEIQMLRSGGADGESARRAEEEVKHLKGENGILKMKLAAKEEELQQIAGERNTLLLERDMNRQPGESGEMPSLETHPIVQQYEHKIKELNDQVTSLQEQQQQMQQQHQQQMQQQLASQQFPQHILPMSPRKSSLAGSNPGREKGHITFYDQRPAQHSDEENVDDGRKHRKKKSKKSKKSSSSSSKRSNRAESHFSLGAENTEQRVPSPVATEVPKPAALNLAADMFAHHLNPDGEIAREGEEYVEGADGELVDDAEGGKTRRLRRRSTKDTLEMAREQIRRGLLFISNNSASLQDDPTLLGQLVKTPSSTKSESYIDQMIANHANSRRRSSSVSFNEIQKFEVPAFEAPGAPHPPPQASRRASNSSRSVSFSDQQISPSSTKSSQNSSGQSSQQNAIALTRMLHQIQADIAVKEELVSQLERAEQEFNYMRTAYDEKLRLMQGSLIQVQRERDTAVKRVSTGNSTGVSTRDSKSIIMELKARYEHRMKKLVGEIGDLRRKYNEVTQKHQLNKQQNETAIRTMRTQVEQLKADKHRLVKRIKTESERIREAAERSQREIQNLRRKEKAAQQEKKRLARSSEMHKLMLDKRNKELMSTTNKLKSVMAILKQTTTPKSITKVIREKRRNTKAVEEKGGDTGSRRSSDEIRAIEEEIYKSGREKKQVLDQAIYTFIQAKQALSLMDDLMAKRDKLSAERQELLDERERIIINSEDEHGNIDLEMEASADDLDDKIESISSEIGYLSARLHALQSEQASAPVQTAEGEDSGSRRSSQSEDHGSRRSSQDGTCMKRKVSQNGMPPVRRKSSGGKKKLSLSLSPNASPEQAYDVAMAIMRNMDQFETQAVLESFFKDIVDLRTKDWSSEMTLTFQQKTIEDLRKTVLHMRRAAVLATVEVEKRNRRLEEEIMRKQGADDRTPSPNTRELEVANIENDAANTLHLFDRIYNDVINADDRGTRTAGRIDTSASLNRRGSYFSLATDDNYYDSPVTYSPASTHAPTLSTRASFSSMKKPLPEDFLKFDPKMRRGSSQSQGEIYERRDSRDSRESRRGSGQMEAWRDGAERGSSQRGSAQVEPRRGSADHHSSRRESGQMEVRRDGVAESDSRRGSGQAESRHDSRRGSGQMEARRDYGAESDSRRGSGSGSGSGQTAEAQRNVDYESRRGSQDSRKEAGYDPRHESHGWGCEPQREGSKDSRRESGYDSRRNSTVFDHRRDSAICDSRRGSTVSFDAEPRDPGSRRSATDYEKSSLSRSNSTRKKNTDATSEPVVAWADGGARQNGERRDERRNEQRDERRRNSVALDSSQAPTDERSARGARSIRDQRRGSLRDASSRSTSMGFYHPDRSPTTDRRPELEHRDSGYYSGTDKRRSYSSMARRGSKDLSSLRQLSFDRSAADSDDNASVTSERRGSIGHIHMRSPTPVSDNVFDRLYGSGTASNSAKQRAYHGERRGSLKGDPNLHRNRALAQLEGNMEGDLAAATPAGPILVGLAQ